MSTTRKMKLSFMAVTALVLIVSFALVNCTGGGGGTASGQNSVLTASRSVAPLDACPNGGISIDAGIDTNSNSVLDAEEVTSTQYVCNGTGLGALVDVTTEQTGANCASGGKKVSVGLDANGNSILDSAEITSSHYICNGATGATGPGITWVNVTGTAVKAVSNTGYLANNAVQVTITLPSAPALGDVVQATGVGAGGWKVAQNALQSIIFKDAIGALWTPRETARPWASVASSADGTKLIAAAMGGQLHTSTDSGVTWTAHGVAGNWLSVASSADGAKLVAANYTGQLYTSIDSGVTWTARDTARSWYSVASSADGTKLVAANKLGQLYTSINSGVTWTGRDTARNWVSVASSADGAKLVAANMGGQLYTSIDSGVIWTGRDIARDWWAVASSADGVKLVAAVDGGQIYTSTDSGVTWIAHESVRNWYSLASSADGAKLAAAVYGGQLYTSVDSGLTWTARGIAGDWYSVASSADGAKLAAVNYNGQLYTSIPSTTPGITGTISGAQYESVDLQCVDTNTFVVRGFVGDLVVQ